MEIYLNFDYINFFDNFYQNFLVLIKIKRKINKYKNFTSRCKTQPKLDLFHRFVSTVIEQSQRCCLKSLMKSLIFFVPDWFPFYVAQPPPDFSLSAFVVH